jgi:hypothetical protein
VTTAGYLLCVVPILGFIFDELLVLRQV